MARASVPPEQASTTGPIVIRRASREDFETVLALRQALRREERPDEEPIDEELRAMTRRQLSASGQIIFLADDGHRTIGILRCALQAPLDRVTRSALLTTAYVRPAWRRQGVMARLVQAASDWCLRHDVRDLRLRNAPDNAAANGAWEALGFKVVQVIRHRRTEP
ncbi:MAG: GNAT family N-acetyltransferase [Gemmatimonadaceae bacterium]|nr:GNAT family N-acetyltransferase [Gemmatimonadaceae bacterium]